MLDSVTFQTSHPKDPDNLLPGSTHPTDSVALISKVPESYLKGHGGYVLMGAKERSFSLRILKNMPGENSPETANRDEGSLHLRGGQREMHVF